MKKLNKKKLALLTACVVSAVANMGFAAEADDLDAYEGADYVVTATRTQIEKKEVPTAVQVVTQEDLKQMGAYSVQDALKYATGIDVQSAGMAGNQIMMRGMNTMHSLVLVDGKRMADEDTPETQNAYVLKRVNMADVDHIEIIRGAGSAIYGSEAMGGVINIITKKASSQNAVVGFSTGSKEISEYFNYASGRQGKVAVKIDGRRTKVRELNGESGTNQFGNKQYFNADIDYAFDENRGLDITAGYMKEKLQSNSRTEPSKMNGMNGYNQNQSYNQERKDFGLGYYGKDSKNDYKARVYYSELSKDQTAIKTHDHTYPSFLNTNDEHSFKKLVLEASNTYTANEKNKITYGFEHKHETVDRTYRSLYEPDPQYDWMVGVSNHTLDTYAAYIQDEIQANDKLLIIPAVRWDYNDKFGSEVTAKLGSTYSLNASNRIKFNVGTGYRAPTMYELYANMIKSMGSGTVYVLGNPDVQPEKSLNIDLAYEGESGKANYKVSPFYNRVKDLIDTDSHYYDANGNELFGYPAIMRFHRAESTYVNISKAEIWGTEAEFGYNFDNHWNVMANYTYLNAKDKDTDERLDNRARHTGVIKVGWTDATENPFNVSLASKWYVDYHYKDTDFTYNTVDFVVDKVFNKNCRVYAGVDNLFNKDLGSSSWLDGRMWRAGAEWTF